MLRLLKRSLAIAAGVVSLPATAVAADLQTGWAAWFHTQKLAPDWAVVADVQLRSSDDWEDVRNLIVRAGLSHSFAPGLSVAGGYAYIPTYLPGSTDPVEHRIWQQLVMQQSVGAFTLTHRLRLEQRFIEQATGANVYSDRLRYFARGLLPLVPSSPAPFTSGNYLALQNEVFVNLSGRGALNGKAFDQNRAYAGFGRRLSAVADIEIGYLNQFAKGRLADTQNHVVQVSVHSRF